MNKNWNSEKYVLILEDFLFSSLQEQFGDSDVIIMDHNASCHTERTAKIPDSENFYF